MILHAAKAPSLENARLQTAHGPHHGNDTLTLILILSKCAMGRVFAEGQTRSDAKRCAASSTDEQTSNGVQHQKTSLLHVVRIEQCLDLVYSAVGPTR